jgi:hypothetical protein
MEMDATFVNTSVEPFLLYLPSALLTSYSTRLLQYLMMWVTYDRRCESEPPRMPLLTYLRDPWAMGMVVGKPRMSTYHHLHHMHQ